MLKIFIIGISLLSFLNSFAQETYFLTNDNPYTNFYTHISNFSYRGITIGMIKSNVESIIEEDDFLEIDDTSYLGLFDKEKPFVLKARSTPYLVSAYFVFDKDVLFNIIIRLNPNFYSYSELLSKAKSNYGPPTDEKNSMAVWQQENYELRVEKPSTVKFFYISSITNVPTRMYISYISNKIREEYSRTQLLPFK